MSSTSARALARLAKSVTVACLPVLAGLGVAAPALAQSDPVVFTFATVGDNRQDPASPDPTTLLAVTGGVGQPSLTGSLLPQDQMYLQNSAAWATIQAGIQAQDPNLLFFNGDMIYGYGRPTLPAAWSSAPTGNTVAGSPSTFSGSQSVTGDAVSEFLQYGYWRGTVAPLFINGTYVIPVPGNHETQCSQTAFPYSSGNKNNCGSGKTAYVDNENMFRYNMQDLINDLQTNVRFSQVTGYFASNVTGLTQSTAPTSSANNGTYSGSQDHLSYSFDVQTSGPLLHFVVINTDPAGADQTPPADWLAADLAAAQGRGATKLFVFGHKPAYTYNYGVASGVTVAAGGLDANTTNPAPLKKFWSTMVQYNATYFSGHEHIVNVQQIADPTGAYPGKAFQVLVGAGGSPFDDKLIGTCTKAAFGGGNGCAEPAFTNPYDRFYGWAFVQIHQSGAVTMNLTGFPDTNLTVMGGGTTQDMPTYDVPGPGFPGVTTLQ
jgi:hypothetical protein